MTYPGSASMRRAKAGSDMSANTACAQGASWSFLRSAGYIYFRDVTQRQ